MLNGVEIAWEVSRTSHDNGREMARTSPARLPESHDVFVKGTPVNWKTVEQTSETRRRDGRNDRRVSWGFTRTRRESRGRRPASVSRASAGTALQAQKQNPFEIAPPS